MKKLHTLTLLLLISLLAGAQTIDRRCASFEHLQQQLTRYPDMRLQQESIERFTQTYSRSHAAEAAQRGTPVYTIPVVVHVLWNTTAQNITDAQIQSQIDVLNKDYQLLNADTASVPSAFKGLVADCQIQFCLAKRDPNGNATTGIVRKQTSKTSFNADNDDAKSSTTGGDNPWTASKYLNLWIVPDITSGGSSGILGYAQFPGGPAATDGVVIGYKYFGTTGTAVAPFNKGRTATHEVGHYLNLRHIWGDEAACSADDLVGDTPLQADKNFGCPSFPRLDACTGSGSGVMFMNYMDYTDDACMYLFTNGQKSRMYGVLAAGGSRNGLTTSDGCLAPAGGGTGCSSAFEPNESLSVAAAVATNTALSAAISSTTDKDWFKFILASASNLNITLGNLGGDYDLILYNSAGTELKRSENGGTTSEAIATTGTAAGTYYVQVFGYNGANSTTCYSLNIGATAGSTSTCPGSYDVSTNGTTSGAAQIPFNTDVKGTLSSSTDQDHYKFVITTGGTITITLGTLPADYDLRLLNSAGTQVAISQNGGTTAETINYTAAAGTYNVRVYGYNGASNASSCYTLKVATGTARREDGSVTQGSQTKVNIYPNPARKSVMVAVSEYEGRSVIRVTDLSGRAVLRQNVQGLNNRVDLGQLASGIYLIQVMTNEGRVLSQRKLVKE